MTNLSNDPIVDALCQKLQTACSDDANLQRVIEKLVARSKAGQAKYGHTLAREDLLAEDWINHAQQEAMDLANYLEVLIQRGMHWLEDAQTAAITLATDLEAQLEIEPC